MLLHQAQAIVYMGMSIAIDRGKESLLRWAPVLHGLLRGLPDEKGRGKAQDCIQEMSKI